jgi:hypothetical protein
MVCTAVLCGGSQHAIIAMARGSRISTDSGAEDARESAIIGR